MKQYANNFIGDKSSINPMKECTWDVKENTDRAMGNVTGFKSNTQ